MEIYVENAEAMQHLGLNIAPLLSGGDIVYLLGELGTGKTTLVKGIAKGMGYTGKVTSPTFTIMNIYPADPDIYHFDFYRLGKNDLSDLGLDDYLAGDGVTLIEWPEIGQGILPQEALIININLVADDYDLGRNVDITAQGSYFEQKIEEIKKACLF